MSSVASLRSKGPSHSFRNDVEERSMRFSLQPSSRANTKAISAFVEQIKEGNRQEPSRDKSRQLVAQIGQENHLSKALLVILQSNYRPNAFIYTKLLQKTRDLKELLILFETIPPNVRNSFHYNIVIKQIVQHNYEKAKRFFMSMPIDVRDAVTYGTMIKQAGEKQDYTFAKQLYQDMPASFKNSVIYNTMIQQAGNNEDYSFAKKIYGEIPRGLKDQVTYNTMIHQAGENGDYDFSKQVYAGMPVDLRDGVTCNTIMQQAGKNRDYGFAKQVYHDMPTDLRSGITYNIIVDVMVKARDWKAAKSYFIQSGLYQTLPMRSVLEANFPMIDLHACSYGLGFLAIKQLVKQQDFQRYYLIVGHGNENDGNYLAFKKELKELVEDYLPGFTCKDSSENIGMLVLFKTGLEISPVFE